MNHRQRGNVTAWFVASVLLAVLAWRFYRDAQQAPPPPPPTPPPAASSVAPASSDNPQTWPPLRMLDLAFGTWAQEDGGPYHLRFNKKQRSKTGEWMFEVTHTNDGGVPSDTLVCVLSPEFVHGGWHGTCSSDPPETIYLRLSMDASRRLFVESANFGGVFVRAEAP